jgi:zinc D-Ala-D-Ala carboxypeptidase
VASRRRARATVRQIRIRRRLAAAFLVVVATAAALAYQMPSSSSSPRIVLSPPKESSSSATASSPPPPAWPAQVLPGEPGADGGPLGEADGAIPDGATVFDDQFPGIANLDPAFLAALRLAAVDARGDGVEFFITSGWRSPEYQERLVREGISKYGSEQEAARWVATAETSTHVAGDAADLGSDASAWLSEHGAEYGLCQIYGNEPWHYELRSEAVHGSCPAMYADPTSDPRMRQ